MPQCLYKACRSGRKAALQYRIKGNRTQFFRMEYARSIPNSVTVKAAFTSNYIAFSDNEFVHASKAIELAGWAVDAFQDVDLAKCTLH